MSLLFKILVFVLFAVQAQAGDWAHFSGEEVWHMPDGKEISHPKLMRRIVIPNKNQIVEESVIQVFGETKVVKFELDVDGQNFTINHTDIKGGGRFYGRPWNWTSWVSTFDTPDGGKLKVADYLSKDGLRSTGELYDKDGTRIVVMEAKLNPVSKATYFKVKEALQLKFPSQPVNVE